MLRPVPRPTVQSREKKKQDAGEQHASAVNWRCSAVSLEDRGRKRALPEQYSIFNLPETVWFVSAVAHKRVTHPLEFAILEILCPGTHPYVNILSTGRRSPSSRPRRKSFGFGWFLGFFYDKKFGSVGFPDFFMAGTKGSWF